MDDLRRPLFLARLRPINELTSPEMVSQLTPMLRGILNNLYLLLTARMAGKNIEASTYLRRS